MKPGWITPAALWFTRSLPTPRDFRSYARRFLGKNHLATVLGTGQTQQLVVVPLPGEEIAAAVKKAQSRGDAVAQLPEPKAADLASARSLPAPGGSVPWKVQPDPAPAPRAKLATLPVRLGIPPQQIQQLLLSPGDVAQAVVLGTSTPDPLARRRLLRAERYDLANGRAIGAFDLFADDGEDPGTGVRQASGAATGDSSGLLRADLSPDASRLIVWQAKDGGRLDVWNLAEGTHLLGWRPYAGAPVDGFAFVDAGRVLTTGNDKLTLWKIPECQAVYVVPGYRNSLYLSPGRKFVAANTGVALEMLEAATGERRGQLEVPGGVATAVPAATFRRDGKEFAAILTTPAGTKLAHWSLSDGSLGGSVDFSGNAQPLAWAGARHVIQAHTLYDVNFKAALRTYTLPGPAVHTPDSPDGRHWFAFTVQNAPFLTAQALPDAQAQSLSAMIDARHVQPVLSPGMSVQLNVAGPDNFRTSVQNAWQQRLQHMGFRIGPGGVSVSVNAQGGQTGKTLEYTDSQLGIRLPGSKKIQVAEFRVACQCVITDAQGAVLARHDMTYSSPNHITTRGDGYQAQVDEAVWNSASSWGCSMSLPMNLYRINGQVLALPVSGTLIVGR